MPKLVTSFVKGAASLAIAAGAAGAIYYSYIYKPAERAAQGPGQGGGAGLARRLGTDIPIPVVAGIAKRADVPVTFDGVGTAKALNTVTVRPQVDGKIMSLAFKDGQDVKKNQLLAKIDPTTYQAQVEQAKARKALSEVQLANARRDMARYSQLSANVVAQKTVDTQRATIDQLEAQIKSDAAAIANLQAFVDWTNVLAPIDGRTGIRLVDEGNLVRAGDAGIVTISQLQPINVLFTLPQQQLAQVNRSLGKGALTVETIDSDNKTMLDRGTVQVVDNQVDQTTGTVRLKAELPNANMQLWPGQFVNVRLLVDTLKSVVVAPTQAIQRGPQGAFVYVIGAEDKVAVRSVTVGLQAELQSVITSGLEADERVVTTGFGRLKDGARVITGEQPDGARPTSSISGPVATGGAAAAVVPPAAERATGGKQGGGGGGSEVRTACRADAEALCPNAERAERRACMEANRDKLSEGCRAALRAAFGGGQAGSTAGSPPKAQP